jgi:eukaryotic-like serine/threonine-protein kinase
MTGDAFDWARLELQQRVGAGAMGEVYRAVDKETGQPVAVKLLHSYIGPEDASRFVREAEVLANLAHPGVVRHVAHGLTPAGAPWLAMEWLEGMDLMSRLRRERMSLAESVQIALGIADGLAHGHARGIVHRDLKPSNVFLVPDAGGKVRVKILDFGLAHVGDRSRANRTSALLGTPGYTAPEQVQTAGEISAASDVYSLGAVLFECITGEPAVIGTHFVAVLAKSIFDEVPRMRTICAGIPEALDDLVARMTDKNARNRPMSGRVAWEALRELDGRVPSTVAPRRTISTPPRSLGSDEDRSVAFVIVGSIVYEPNGMHDAFEKAAKEHDGRMEKLVDGSLAVMLTGTKDVHALAARAARCGLAFRAISRIRAITIVMGRSDRPGPSLLGRPLGRAPSAADWTVTDRVPIRVDSVAAGFLDARFDVRESEGAFELWREHELAEGTRLLIGKATPCVGRDREIRQLESLFDACVNENAAQVVLVTAPAGIGKSRLAQEFLRSVRARSESVSIWVGRGDSLRASSPLGMLGQLLRSAFGLRENDHVDVRRASIRSVVADRVNEKERAYVAAFIGEIMGTTFPDDETPRLGPARQDAALMTEEMRTAFVDFLLGECARRPLLLVLEDLHWADKATLQMLDAAQRALEDAPLFVLALARPEIQDVFPKLWSGSMLQQIRLRELNKRAIGRLATHVLGSGASSEVVERLARLSEGNAFYLEELLRLMAEGREEGLPEMAQLMVQSRLGALDEPSRRHLRAVSVFGEVCWPGAVAKLLGGTDGASNVRDALLSLVNQELLVKRGGSRFAGEDEIAFRHALLREGAYSMLSDEDRALGHKLAGEWLEEHGELDAHLLAKHYELGADVRRAMRWCLVAAEQTLERNDLDEALDAARKGLALARRGVEGAYADASMIAAFEHVERMSERRRTESVAPASNGSEPTG